MTHRYIARIETEAETGLFAGSGESSLLKDALVQKDHLGLPMIQGTSLAGVLRHSVEQFYKKEEDKDKKEEEKKLWDDLFGFQEPDSTKGLGSRLRVSSAYMLLNKTTVSEGLTPDIPESVFQKYDNLPVRQHVRINDKGVAEDKGLFDNEMMYRGTRFKFEMELKGALGDENSWKKLIEALHHPLFRIGQGTRKGYGKLKILEVKQRIFDLKKANDFDDYLSFNPSLNEPFGTKEQSGEQKIPAVTLTQYTLNIKPDRFFIFSLGGGDDQVDNIPVTEDVAVYDDTTISFPKYTLIPASSVKGALAHRTAFYFNKRVGRFADEGQGNTGSENEAVTRLFGTKAGSSDAQRGRVIINDIFCDSKIKNDKIFNHVAVDRFTGGAMDGALFSEKVSYLPDESGIQYEIFVDSEGLDEKDKEEVIGAFENALEDVCKGLLPLGGMTTKGHGIFTGELLKDGKSLYNYNQPE